MSISSLHQFNNQMTAIMGYCDLALDSGDDIDRMRFLVSRILATSQRAHDSTSTLMSVIKNGSLESSVVNVAAIVERIWAQVFGSEYPLPEIEPSLREQGCLGKCLRLNKSCTPFVITLSSTALSMDR